MKTFEIKKTEITENKVRYQGNPDLKLDYKDLIEICLDVLPQGGFTPSDIRERNRIQNALDKAGKTKVDFEDADWDSLKKIVKASRWNIRDKEIFEFLEKFE